MSRDYRLYLDDILTAGEKVIRYTKGLSFDNFVADDKTFDAVIRNLQIIGEASAKVPGEVRFSLFRCALDRNCWIPQHPRALLFWRG